EKCCFTQWNGYRIKIKIQLCAFIYKWLEKKLSNINDKSLKNMKITYLGQNCLWIETKEYKIMVDPFITGNPINSNIKVSDYYPDYILLTHAHQDHVADVETLATLGSAKIISNYEIVSYYEKKGYQGHGMNTGGSFSFP